MLEGGTRTRRAPRVAALVALGLAAVGAAVVGVIVTDPGGRSSSPAAALRRAPAPLDSGTNAGPAATPAAVSLERKDLLQVRFDKPPRAGLLFDMASGRVLWRRRPRTVEPVASLTKIMTALLVADRTEGDERVRIAGEALDYAGSGVGVFKRGRRFPINGVLAGMLVVSGNDAAIALANHVAGSERRFVRLMNRRARVLGLACTRFASSHGLEPRNRSCAADLAALTRLAMRRSRIRRFVGSKRVVVRFPIRTGKLYLNSTNPLLTSGYRGAIGLKTGFTRKAGRSLVAVARRRGRTLGVVLLHSPNPGHQAKQLLDRGFRRAARGG